MYVLHVCLCDLLFFTLTTGRPMKFFHCTPDSVIAGFDIERLIEQGAVYWKIAGSRSEPAPEQMQPASLDLKLSNVVRRVRHSCLPESPEPLFLPPHAFPASGFLEKEPGDFKKTMNPGSIYVFELRERLALPENVYAVCNPKSTAGRLDILCRVFTEKRENGYNKIPKGYEGRLFLEVIPRSIPVTVTPQDCLAQIRFQVGTPIVAFSELWADTSEVYESKEGLTSEHAIEWGAREHYDPTDYFSPGRSAFVGDHFEFAPGKFYLLKTFSPMEAQAVILDDVDPVLWDSDRFCADLMAYNENLGDFQPHFAGFIDPGFRGRIVLEFRAPTRTLLWTRQPVTTIRYFRLSRIPRLLYGESGNSYQSQETVRLPRQFKPFPQEK